MTRPKPLTTKTKARPVSADPGAATRAKLREIVSAIAADVIAETAERVGKGPRREATALRITRRTRVGPTLPRRA